MHGHVPWAETSYSSLDMSPDVGPWPKNFHPCSSCAIHIINNDNDNTKYVKGVSNLVYIPPIRSLRSNNEKKNVILVT